MRRIRRRIMNSVVQEMNSQTVIQTLEIRLQGIREITKRARFSFIVLIVASCAIFIATYNGHFSWNRKAAFPYDMAGCLDKIKTYSEEELKGCLICQKINPTPEEKQKCEDWKSQTVNNQKTEEETKNEKIDFVLKDENLGLKKVPVPVPVKPKANQNPEGNNANQVAEKDKVPQSSSVIPLDEYNRRNLAAEWLKSMNISIGLLGVVVNMNDLNLLGSATLMIMSFWLLFNIRRENRAIVGLLKDVRNITNFDADKYKNLKEDEKLKIDNMLIASMAFQEVAHSMTFVSVAKDLPLSSTNIFDEKQNATITDEWVKRIIFLIRLVGMSVLLFSPVLVISFSFYADFISMEMNTAFYHDFPKIGGTMSDYFMYVFKTRMWIAVVCLTITLIICCLIIILQLKTTDALYVFAEKLGGIDLELPLLKRIKNRWKPAQTGKETENEQAKNGK